MSEKQTINGYYMKTPASWCGELWREATPAGNGLTGILHFGGVKHDTVLINRCDLWQWGCNEVPPVCEGAVSRTREHLEKGEFTLADPITSEALNETGYKTHLAYPSSLCALDIKLHHETVFSHYRRSLDMDNAEISLEYHMDNVLFNRRMFVSRAEDVTAIKLSCSESILSLDLSLIFYDIDSEASKKKREETLPTLLKTYENGVLTYSAQNDDGDYYGVCMKLHACDGEVCVADNILTIKDASFAELMLVTFANKPERVSARTEAVSRLNTVKKSYEELFSEHAPLHHDLMGRTTISFGEENKRSNEELLLEAYEKEASTELLEKLWKFGRYLFISGVHENGLPFPLYGLWHGDYRLVWVHIMANENVQMSYWHVPTGGLTEFIRPLIHYFFSMMDQFRINARNVYGCRGIYIPAGTTKGVGHNSQVVPVIVNWVSAAGWISNHFYDYFSYYKDDEIVKSEIIPFMYETALFYEDYLTYDNGKVKFYPSVSPENTPANLMKKPGEKMRYDHDNPTTVNATMDIAILKEFFTHFTEICEYTGEHADRLACWRGILAAIPEYQKNPDGDIREWMDERLEDNYEHRHLSHIFPVFPGHEYADRSDEDMVEAFKRAVDKRILGSQSGWSLAHMSSIYVRMGQAEKALGCIDTLTRCCLLNNMFTLHNDWRMMGLSLDIGSFAPVQLDALLGVVNAIQEMIIYSYKNNLRILPALPKRLKNIRAKNLYFPYGTVDIFVENGYINATINCSTDCTLNLYLPELQNSVLTGKDMDNTSVGGSFVLNLLAGNSYSIKGKLL